MPEPKTSDMDSWLRERVGVYMASANASTFSANGRLASGRVAIAHSLWDAQPLSRTPVQFPLMRFQAFLRYQLDQEENNGPDASSKTDIVATYRIVEFMALVDTEYYTRLAIWGTGLPARSRVSDIVKECVAHTKLDTVEIRSALISDMRVGQPVLILRLPRPLKDLHRDTSERFFTRL